MTGKTAVFTIVSLNYGAYARTLMESVAAAHPDWARFVLLVDRTADADGFGAGLFSTLQVEELPLPRKREFLFRYDIMELNTAVKPTMFAELRRRGFERVVYIDPDILVIQPLVDVVKLLDQGATAVVTPHLTAPLDDGRHPSELEIMRAGAYNLGFLALGGTRQADAFIKWWEEKLEYGAVSDPARGLFTDQKWVDLAPGMFGGFAILRDPGYNVAYWNLPHRPVTQENGAWLAGGSALRFFHFSGFDPLNPKPFSKHQDRLTLASIGPARELALEYAEKVLGHNYAEFRTRRYAFGTFADGTPIPSSVRALYREDDALRALAGGDPFAVAGLFAQGESGGLPTILRALWLQHPHLQRAFPDPLESSREGYYRWFVDAGAVEMGIAQAFVLPVALALERLQGQRNAAVAQRPAAGGLPSGASVWTRALVYLHRRATGGSLGAARMMEYQRVDGPVAFVKLLVRQFRASRWGQRIGLGLPAAAQANPMTAVMAGGRSGPAPRWRSEGYAGLYAQSDQEAWWVGRHARFAVERFEGTLLRIRGIHQGELHHRVHGQYEMGVTVYLNDGPRKEIKVPPGPFDLTIDLEQRPDAWPAVLHMLPEHSFVPSEHGIGNDRRRLSIQLSGIELGGVAVFDTADPFANAARGFSRPAAHDVPGVNVIGYARSEHGVGQSLRQFARALDGAAIPSAIIDFNHNNLSRVEDDTLARRIVAEPSYPINVFHINADQMPEAEMQLPAHVFARYNIGFWHWELPEMLDEHLAGFRSLNEVWVPTAFVQDAVAKKSPVPVVLMPHAMQFTVSANANRARFGLPEDKFLFLMMYDFSSYQERKNPRAALRAFDEAFAFDDKRVALVIKTQNAQHHEEDVRQLREALMGRDNVVWINETLSRQQVYDLQSVCDAFLSLHRSEGYGLGPAEAMFLGKPAIATNWSGNTQFMRQDNSLPVDYRLIKIEKDIGVYRAGQTWAEPDVEHAASLMRRVVDDDAWRARIAAAAARTMREEYSPEVIGRRIAARLRFIERSLLA